MLKERRRLAGVVARAWEKHLSTLEPEPTLEGPGSGALGAWFLGPVGENKDLVVKLISEAVANYANGRRAYFAKDPEWITEEIRQSQSYVESVRLLREKLHELQCNLEESVPFFSYRYQGHMLWDITLPAALAYFTAMLHNQNNVAAEASPVTTKYEMFVGDDLCRMLGYHVPKRARDPQRGLIRFEEDGATVGAWGHITCDGSVANIEAMWAARNLKCYPIAVAEALRREQCLAPAQGLLVQLPNGETRRVVELDTWQLLNLKADDTLDLAQRIQREFGVPEEALQRLNAYTLQELGFTEFNRRFSNAAAQLTVLVPATRHYSFPKAASLLGIGTRDLILVRVDLDARMSLSHLRTELDRCLAERRPVVMVVAVIGSTEEGAVDPLDGIIALRTEYRRAGLDFVVHVDGAWGGYFASMLREPSGVQASQSGQPGFTLLDDKLEKNAPQIALSEYVAKQYTVLQDADSITVDPHKAGFIPYPAGGLCYRNSAMRHLVAFTAPVVYHGGVDPTVGVYGIEGSKPGAAAAATYLSHRLIRVDRTGYGRILGRCMFNSKRFYAALVTMVRDDDSFIVRPFQRLPAERDGGTPEQIAEQLAFIGRRIVSKPNDELLSDKDAMKVLRELGSDELIIAYAFNFKTNGELNRSVDRLNQLNRAIFTRLSKGKWDDGGGKPPLFVTASSFDPEIYGRELVRSFMERLGVEGTPDVPIEFLISTTMDPWLTDTADGNFIPTLIESLRREVRKAIEDVR